MVLDTFLLLVGLVLLYFGAELLVAGASSVALRKAITPLIVGCTVVAFGTSAPELVVSLVAVFSENDDISVGNIIGSNIANLALILGTASLLKPIQVQADVIRREYPVMVISALMLILLAHDGELSQGDGAILLGGMVVYLGYMFYIARLEMAQGKQPALTQELEAIDFEQSSDMRDGLKVLGGAVGLAAGAQLMVMSAVSIATAFEVPQMLIGISIVAVGTSLPELATSVMAAYKDESDISVGNVIGSNVFNTFLVLGIVASISGVVVGPEAVDYDLWIMLAVSVLVWPIMWTGRRIQRLEGGFLLLGYFSYIVWIFLR